MRDAYDVFVEHDRRQEAELEKLPKCAYCGEPIQDDYLFDIGGEIICEECVNDNFRKDTENFIN